MLILPLIITAVSTYEINLSKMRLTPGELRGLASLPELRTFRQSEEIIGLLAVVLGLEILVPILAGCYNDPN